MGWGVLGTDDSSLIRVLTCHSGKFRTPASPKVTQRQCQSVCRPRYWNFRATLACKIGYTTSATLCEFPPSERGSWAQSSWLHADNSASPGGVEKKLALGPGLTCFLLPNLSSLISAGQGG